MKIADRPVFRPADLRPLPLWRHLVRPIAYGTIASMLVLAMVWKILEAERAREVEEGRAKTLQALSLVRARLEGTLNSHIYLTRGIVGIVRAHPEISHREFDTLAQELIKEHSGIRSIQLARNAVISHVYPLEGNEKALGRNLLTLEGQAPAVERAVEERSTVVAGPVKLVQGGYAFVSRTAIFVDDPDTGERFWGLTSLLIDRERLLETAASAGAQAGLRIAIRGKDALGAHGEVFYGDPAIFNGNALLADIQLPNGSWQLGARQVAVPPGYYTEHARIAWTIGLAAAVIVGVLIGMLAYRPQQILRINEQLRVARRAAEQAAEARSRFLAAASHDLRQPLHALGIFVRDLAEKGLQVNELRPLIEKIRLSAESLTELIHSIMDISRLDAGVVQPNLSEFPMRPLLERLAVENAPYAMEKGLRLRVAPTSAIVRSDPIMLECIIRNLLINAIKYTTSGGILMGCRVRSGMVRIEVWDTGRGIEASEQTRIFDEFYQVVNADSDRRNGLGLGLSIVRRMASLLGHRVDLRSRPGRGSVFSVDASQGVAPARAFAQDPMPVGFNLKHLTVMVVDDEHLIRQAMRGLLEHWGCRVLTAANGAEAEALLRDGDVIPNLLLCDFVLGNGEKGNQVITRLRELAGGGLECVLISGHSTEEVYREAEACGSRFLAKPVAPAKLQSLLRRLAAESVAAAS